MFLHDWTSINTAELSATQNRVGLKIEIHEIHQNLQNPVSINRNLPSAIKSTSIEQKLIIEIQRNP